MLQIISSVMSEKNTCFNEKNYVSNITDELNSSYFIFSILSKYASFQDIKFDNVYIEKKREEDKNTTICNSFLINNLLNILNKTDLSVFDINNTNPIAIQKKKLNGNNSESLNLHKKNFLKNIPTVKKIKTNQNKKMFTKDLLLIQAIKNKNKLCHIEKLHQNNKLNSVYTKKYFFLKKNHDQFLKNNVNILSQNKDTNYFLTNQKNVSYLNGIKNRNNSLLQLKNIYKNDNITSQKGLVDQALKQNNTKLNKALLISNNLKYSIEWKKSINQKILLSILNKNNQVEIDLKPEYLGSIHILINMQENKAILNFISNDHAVRCFLDNYMSFLDHALIKHGIKLEKFSISSSLKDKKLNNYKNSLNQYKFQKELHSTQQNIDFYV